MLLPFGCLLRKRRHPIGKYLIWWILNAEKYEKNRHDTWRRRKIKPGFIIERIFLQVMLIDVLKSNKIFNSNTEIKK